MIILKIVNIVIYFGMELLTEMQLISLVLGGLISSVFFLLPLNVSKIKKLAAIFFVSLLAGVQAGIFAYLLLYFAFFKKEVVPFFSKFSLAIFTFLSWYLFISADDLEKTLNDPYLLVFLLLPTSLVLYVLLASKAPNDKIKILLYFWQLIVCFLIFFYFWFFAEGGIPTNFLGAFTYGISFFYLLLNQLQLYNLILAFPISWIFKKFDVNLWDYELKKEIVKKYSHINPSIILVLAFILFLFGMGYLNLSYNLLSDLVFVNIFLIIIMTSSQEPVAIINY